MYSTSKYPTRQGKNHLINDYRQFGKTYQIGEITVKTIRGVNCSIEPVSFVSFVGPSGSGKTTLLNMIGCLDPPTGGYLQVVGQDIANMKRKGCVLQ